MKYIVPFATAWAPVHKAEGWPLYRKDGVEIDGAGLLTNRAPPIDLSLPIYEVGNRAGHRTRNRPSPIAMAWLTSRSFSALDT